MADVPAEPEMLDLSGFTTREECLRRATAGCPSVYTAIAREALSDGTLTQARLLFMAMVSRARGLHEGIVRELSNDNPHAVLPLKRAWAELIAIMLYTLRKPAYIFVLLSDPKDRDAPKRKSFEAIFHAVREDAEQMRLVYGELSEYSHFGLLAIYNVHSIAVEDDRTTVWTDVPRWRDERHFKAACAQAAELAEACEHALRSMGDLVRPVADKDVVGSFDVEQ